MCLGVHLPYSPKWYWPVEGFFGVPEMDRYFDRNQIFSRLLKTGREFLHLNDHFMESIERGGSYAFDLSGPFLEQCRWDLNCLSHSGNSQKAERWSLQGAAITIL
ncbi:polysaccharide deacetylase family protein [Methanosarcina horonobensis]|uniref:hypothetical protein n=1 Tax=Methanosarcina horonobensis TaxID=418008 RepID=UPI0022B92C38|nr:hypothetical protein [Methanosarcina horonobensis]